MDDARELMRRARRIAVARVIDDQRAPDEQLGLHAHPGTTLVIALAGVVRVERARGRVDLLAGEAAVVTAGTWHHHADVRRGSACLMIGAVPRSLELLVQSGGLWWAGVSAREPGTSRLERLPRAGEGERVRLAQALAGEALRATPLSPVPPAVRRMLSYLRRNRLRRIGAADVVHASGLGRTYAHALFRAHVGLGIKQALTRDRLLIARALLRTPLRVDDIARRCGFADLRDLARCCRREFGAGPRRLRALAREQG
ncbi:MAG TPA: AraC family transcriptional regulator [Planctomycetota bacterium]|nr:AraC family transcriptional regulator [Planctomycetota bacterium]